MKDYDLTPLLREAHGRYLSDADFHLEVDLTCRVLNADIRLIGDVVMATVLLQHEFKLMEEAEYKPPTWMPIYWRDCQEQVEALMKLSGPAITDDAIERILRG